MFIPPTMRSPAIFLAPAGAPPAPAITHHHAHSFSSVAQTVLDVPIAWLAFGFLLSVLFRLCGVICRTCRRRRSSGWNSSSSSSGPSSLSVVEISTYPLPVPTTVWSGALTVCAICMEEFADGEAVRVLPRCGHGYHKSCVDTWLVNKATCPSCRRPVMAEFV